MQYKLTRLSPRIHVHALREPGNEATDTDVSIVVYVAGAAAAAKKWKGLINIHDLDCTMLHTRIFERVANAVGTLTATAPSICPHMHPYCAARMLNQLRHGHRAWPCFS